MKKQIVADRVLAELIGVEQGALISYADIQKGLHQYIKRNKLRVEEAEAREVKEEVEQPVAPIAPTPTTAMKICMSCGSSTPLEAFYCDRCGAPQYSFFTGHFWSGTS